jgi:hypothetical protein
MLTKTSSNLISTVGLGIGYDSSGDF